MQVARETQISFRVKHFFSIDPNNPSSEAAQPGDAPLAFAGTPHPPKKLGLPPPPFPVAQRQMAGVKPPRAAGMSFQLIHSASHSACWVCSELRTSRAICKLIGDWQLHSSSTAHSIEHIFK